MTETVTTYTVHQNILPLLLELCIGWVLLYVGVLRWGKIFVFSALPIGMLIPASQFFFRGLWRALLDPEIVAWNASFWLIPAIFLSLLALFARKGRRACATLPATVGAEVRRRSE
jgi:hypothetical protein